MTDLNPERDCAAAVIIERHAFGRIADIGKTKILYCVPKYEATDTEMNRVRFIYDRAVETSRRENKKGNQESDYFNRDVLLIEGGEVVAMFIGNEKERRTWQAEIDARRERRERITRQVLDTGGDIDWSD